MSVKAGKRPKERKLATTTTKTKLQANQWQNTPQQNEFMEHWLNVDSPTFGNAYRSALQAKYSNNYALQVASVGTQWLTDYHKASKLQLEHLEAKLIKMINGRPDSKSPDDTKVKAIELIARLTGKLDNKGAGTTTNILVQPILNGVSVNPVPVDSITVDTTPNNLADNPSNNIDTSSPDQSPSKIIDI